MLFMLLVSLLAILAFCMAGIATGIVGTIVLTNFFGVNYETAGRTTAIMGWFVAFWILLACTITGPVALLTASLWILGLAVAAIGGWLLLVFSQK